MHHPLLSVLLSLALLTANTQLCFPAQANAPNQPQGNQTLSPAAETIKRQVEKFRLGKDVTVILVNGREYYGAISGIGADDFQIVEVDLKQSLSFKYGEVRRVRKGYGGWNYAAGKRVNPRTNLISFGAVLGGILLVAILVAKNTR